MKTRKQIEEKIRKLIDLEKVFIDASFETNNIRLRIKEIYTPEEFLGIEMYIDKDMLDNVKSLNRIASDVKRHIDMLKWVLRNE